MYLITHLSKITILAFLSCILLVAWKENPLVVMEEESVVSVTTPLVRAIKKPVANTSVNSIWNQIRQEFKLDNKDESQRVRKEIRILLSDQKKLMSILKAAGPYLYFIHTQTQARGLPAEIALIPIIESEFNPNDYSTKGATGLWQLMSGTAHDLGVKVKTGYDGRRNVIASTHAALTYFRDLGNYFNGNWYLAIAAYNSGQGKVKSAMRRTGSNNYWNLPLPAETKMYVPKLLAVAAIIKEPKKYGIELPNITNTPYFSEVKTTKPFNLTQVANLSGVNIKTLRTLNPDYRNGRTPQKTNNTLLVPVDKASIVKGHYGGGIAKK